MFAAGDFFTQGFRVFHALVVVVSFGKKKHHRGRTEDATHLVLKDHDQSLKTNGVDGKHIVQTVKSLAGALSDIFILATSARFVLGAAAAAFFPPGVGPVPICDGFGCGIPVLGTVVDAIQKIYAFAYDIFWYHSGYGTGVGMDRSLSRREGATDDLPRIFFPLSVQDKEGTLSVYFLGGSSWSFTNNSIWLYGSLFQSPRIIHKSPSRYFKCSAICTPKRPGESPKNP